MRSRTPLLTIEDAAELLNVRPGYIRRLVRERRIPFIRVGKFVRFEPRDLEALVQAGRVEPLPQ